MGTQGYNHGDIGWTELNAQDPGGAMTFFAQLLGLDNKGEMMPGYHILGRGEEMLAGAKGLEGGAAHPQWIPYFTVSNLDETLAKATELGGSLVGETMPLPDGGRYALVKDAQGVLAGVAQYAGNAAC